MVRYDKGTARRGRQYVKDRRSSTGGRSGGLGRGGVAAGGGLGAIIIAILGLLLGGNILGGSGGGSGTSFGLESTNTTTFGSASDVGGQTATVDPDADTIEFMAFLMADIQDTWTELFEQAGLNYQPTALNVFSGSVSTNGCGNATSAVGPFYCPAPNDMEVYIDLDFYDDLATRFDAPGDFAQAYVIAHEIGHHLQAILGISDAVRRAQSEDANNRNQYSILQELQADCFAGVWAHSASNRLTLDTGLPIIEPGDIEEGLAAAASVGDDRIQEAATGQINPHTWTHGSSEQRVRWFRVGFDTGDPEACDTFSASNP